MASLVYTYIEKMGVGIRDEELRFSNTHRFEFDLKQRQLFYKRQNSSPFFGNKVSNISLIVGKNGVGKSSVLDLISLNVKENTRQRKRDSYFNIFHIKDNIFHIEGTPSLLNSINNLEVNKGLFKVKQSNSFQVVNDAFYQSEIILSLIKSRPSVSWFNRVPYLGRNTSKTLIEKNIKQVESAENVFKFISENHNNRISNKAIYLKISQKQVYPTNASQILDEIYGNEQIINPRFMLPERLLKKLKVNITEDAISFNNRVIQNYYFARFKKEFYIIQFLEKYLLALIKSLTDSGQSRDKVINIIRQELNISVSDYALVISEYPQEEEAQNFLNKKLDILYSMVNNLRDWYRRVEFFEGQSNRKTPFINRDDLKNLVNGLKKLGEVGSDYLRGNSFKLEVSSKSIFKKKDVDFDFIQLLMFEFIDLFSVQFENLSDGEVVYYNTFSSIFAEIQKANERNQDCILVLDEPDLNLHPEWCRVFIGDCINIVNEFSKVKVQFIIATHSPYMISDLPRDNVYTLQKKSNEGVSINLAKKTFAANIIDILSDSFFLDYTVGEFAKNKLKSISQEEMKYIDDSVLKVLIEKNNGR